MFVYFDAVVFFSSSSSFFLLLLLCCFGLKNENVAHSKLFHLNVQQMEAKIRMINVTRFAFLSLPVIDGCFLHTYTLKRRKKSHKDKKNTQQKKKKMPKK